MGIWIFPPSFNYYQQIFHVCLQTSFCMNICFMKYVCFQLSLARIREWNSRMVVLCGAFLFSTSNVHLFQLYHELQSMV